MNFAEINRMLNLTFPGTLLLDPILAEWQLTISFYRLAKFT